MKKKRWDAFLFREGMLRIIRVMKLVSIFLLVGFLQVTANIYSQTANIYLSLKETALSDVIKEIQKQTEFTFFYSPEDVKGIVVPEVEMEQASLEKVLDLCLKGTNLEYEIVHKAVILKKAKEIEKKPSDGLLKEPPKQQPQKKELKGKVLDAKGEVVPGTTVIVKGTTIGTITDSEGKFAFSVPMDSKVLSFSFVGFKTQEVQIGNQTSINIILQENTVGVDEVVVVGYGTQKKATVTGAVAAISGKLLVQSPVANISNALVGKMPGLLALQGSGEPGKDNSTLRIRGVGSFSGSSDPLIMVDGIEAQNYNNIDPNDIESISILKDASATAVYGVRGANGVLLITTKRGLVGKPKVSFSSNYAVTRFADLSQNTNAYEYSTMYNEALKYDSFISGGYVPKYTEEDIRLYKTHEDPIFHPDKNWYKELLKPASAQTQNSLSINGGTKRVKYFVSAGAFSQQGLVNSTEYNAGYDPQIYYKRYSFRSNFDFDISKRLSANINISTQIETRKGRNEVETTSSLISAIASANPVNYPGLIDGKVVDIGAISILSSPYYYSFGHGYQSSYTNYLNGLIRLNYKLDFITSGLSTHASIAYQNYNSQLGIYNTNYVNYRATKLPDNSVVLVPQGEKSPFSYSESITKNRKQYSEFGLDYSRSFGDHNISGLFLYNQTKYFSPDLAFLIPNGYQGLVGRIAYDYKGRYMAEFNLGYNGTENFAPSKRFGFFPAYSLGWVLSQESFFPRNQYITLVKFRGSYGEVGNDKIGGDRFLYRPSSYNYSGSYMFGEVGSSYNSYGASNEGKIGNPDLTWERAKKADIGFELGVWKDKIKISADIFQEKRDNILANLGTVPFIVGANLPAYNLGRMKNSGFDGDISFNDKVGNFYYWLKANYTYATNVIEFQDEVTRSFSYQYRTGQRVGQFFGLVSEGLYNTWEEVNDPNRPVSIWANNKLQPGDIRYKDVNGDGKVDNDDAVPIGYSNFPEQIYGISFGGQYKGFDFSVLLQGAGLYSHQYSGRNQVSFGNGGSTNVAMKESWSQERYDQGLPINYPHLAVESAVQTHNYQYSGSSFWLHNSSYLRLKNMEIGYTLNNNFLLKKVGFETVRIYVNGNNLLTFDKLISGIDPEQTFGSYPMTKVVNFGFSVKF